MTTVMTAAAVLSLTVPAFGDTEGSESRSRLPLHLQIPSKDAPPEEMLRWILSPGNGSSLDGILLEGYLNILPADAFPTAYEALSRLQLRHRSPEMFALIGAWAKKDPEAAWKIVEPWIARTFKDDHFIDEWAEILNPPKKPTPLTPGIVVPESDHLGAFESGLSQSNVPGEVKSSLQHSYDRAMLQVFPERDASPQQPTTPATPEANAEQPPPERESEVDFTFVREVLDAPLPALPRLLKSAIRRQNEPALVCGLRRWVMQSPASAPEIIAWAEKHAAEQEGSALETWSVLMPKQAHAWLISREPEELVELSHAIVAHLPDDLREDLLQRVQDLRGPGSPYNEDLSEILAEWAVTDPSRAFDKALNLGGPPLYSVCAEEAFYRVPALAEFRQPLISAIQSIPVLVEDDYAYIIMEEWGDIDVAEAVRYGVDWLLQDAKRGSDYSRPIQHLIDVWTGKEDPDDGCMDDRTYGCLRMWALVDPEGMKAWIATQQDPRIRQALEWLQSHAAGGLKHSPN